MKNLLLVPLILSSNMILGATAGFYAATSNPISIFSMCFGGIGLGFINGLKFEIVSAITDYFKPEDNTAIKVGVNLGIDVISGGYALAANNIDVGAKVFGILFVMDVINFGIESYIDNSECTELSNIQVI